MARIDSFLRLVVDQKASDLHLPSGSVPIIRHNGDLIPLPFRVLTSHETGRLVNEVLTPEFQKRLAERNDLDFMYELPGVARFRGNAFMQNGGLAAVFRVIPHEIPSLDKLGISSQLERFTRISNGLVLVTGPTGSGKSTTMAAMVHEINRRDQRHIITLEDPVEFVHSPIKSAITQRQIGRHTNSFADALRAALRESPDVLVVGELRDLESVSLALSAAETGVLVIATLHTNSAVKSIYRIVDIMPDEEQDQMRAVLSVLLRGVISQRLVKRRDGDSRIAAIEILLQDVGISNMIRENKLHQLEAHLQSMNPKQTGMQTLDRCLLGYLTQGLIELEEALTVAASPEQLHKSLREIEASQAGADAGAKQSG